MNALRRLCSSRSFLELTPRRALLYVPGDSEKKIIAVAEETDADCVCLDLEDAVAHSKKAESRDIVTKALATFKFGRSERCVRVNAVQSPYLEDDLRCLFDAEQMPDALVVPKVDTVDHVHWLFARINALGGARLQAENRRMPLLTMCESGMGMLNLRDIFEACLSYEDRVPLKLEACIFGGEDFCASQGIKHQPGTDDTKFARRWIVLHSRAYGIQPIDETWIDFKNHHAFTMECEQGRRMGFAGKQLIHPTQIGPTHAAFSPDHFDVEEAQALVQAFEEQERQGEGSFVFRDKFVDISAFLQAKNLLEFAKRIGVKGIN